MSIQFQDNFASYTPGQDPFGNWSDLGFFQGEIVTFSNFFGRTGQGYHMGLDGPIAFGILTAAAQTPTATIVWAGLGNNNLGPTVTVNSGTATTGLGQQFAKFLIEPDHSASIYVPSIYGGPVNIPTAIANSGKPLYEINTWQLWQVAFQFTSQSGTGTDTNAYLAVQADVWFSGTHIMGGFGVTQVNVAALPLGAQINRYSFGGGSSHLGEIYATTDLLGTATFPFPGTPLGGAARVTQGVMEVAKQPAGVVRNARVTQGTVEVVKLPGTSVRNARITQGVVEIIKRAGGVGWRVYEA